MKTILQILKWVWGIIAGLSLLSVIVLPFLYAVLDMQLASWILWTALIIVVLYEIIPHKRKIEPKNKFQKVACGGFPLLLFIFASIFIINYYDTWYNWYWFIFILAIFAIPYGFISLKAWYEDRYETTKEDNKNAILNIFKLCLFYWLVDLFYMAWFKDWLLWQYIFGGFILLIIFFNLSSAFLSNSEKNKTVKWMLLQDFVIGIALTIYLIYIIPAQFTGLQTIVTTVVAAVYGGLLTLVGVAWTIRRQDKDRMDEQREKAKPFFGIVDITNSKTKDAAINCIECVPKGEPNVSFCLSIGFENSDKAPFFLDKIKIGNDEFFPDSKLLVSKSMVFSVHILTATGEYNKEEKILLYITDTNYEERIYELIATNEHYEAYHIKEYTEEIPNV